jgi:hypothetical protein
MTNRQRKRMKRTGSKMSKREMARRGRQASSNDLFPPLFYELLVSRAIRMYAFAWPLKPWRNNIYG